jgi:hypothetical protein
MKTPIQSLGAQSHSSAIAGWRSQYALVITLVSFGFASAVRAQTYSGSETGSFGTLLNQNNSSYPNNGCVPTAVAQGLSYLYNYSPNSFAVNPNNITAVNALGVAMGTTDASGTTYAGRVNGTGTYLTGAGDMASVVGGQYSSYYDSAATIGTAAQNSMAANGVASFLANALNANEGVEFALLWGTLASGTYSQGQGGHFVTLQSLSYNGGTGTGSVTFIDPGDAQSWNGSLSLITGGTYKGDLYVTYSGLYSPPDEGNSLEEPSNSPWLDGTPVGNGGVIINDMAEAVPEPATFGILGALGGLLVTGVRYLPRFRRVA